jgi:ribosomal protein L37E
MYTKAISAFEALFVTRYNRLIRIIMRCERCGNAKYCVSTQDYAVIGQPQG